MTTLTAYETADIKIEDYALDNVGAEKPTLNSGLANRILTRSPLHAWYAHPKLNPACERETNDAMDFGSAVHAALLEGLDIVEVVDADSWRTKVSHELREAARDCGKVPLLAKDALVVADMVAAAWRAIEANHDLDGLGQCDAERTLVWEDPSSAWLRCRPDWMSRDHSIVLSYKTTSTNAEPDAFTKTLLNFGYDMQAAFELDGVKAVYGAAPKFYIWIVQEVQPPYAVSFLGLSPEMRAYGMDRMGLAVDLWQHCMETNTWPGYPNRVAYVSPPAWARAQLDEKLGVLS